MCAWLCACFRSCLFTMHALEGSLQGDQLLCCKAELEQDAGERQAPWHDSAAACSVSWSARLQRRVLRNRARAACPAQVSPSVTVKPRDLPTRGWASLWCATRGTDPNDRWSAPTPRTARRAAARRGRSWLQSGWRIALGSHARSALAPCTQAMADQRDCDAREGDPQQCRLGCGGDDLVSQNRHQPVPAHGCHRLRAA